MAELNCCPTCGRPTVGDIFDDASHEIVFGGSRLRLSPMRWRVLDLMRRHPGQFISIERFHSVLYEGANDARGDEVVRRHVQQLRALLKGTPLLITRRYGIGYRLERAIV